MTSSRRKTFPPFTAAVAVFIGALAFRGIYFLTARDDPLMTYVDAVPDAWLYHHWALDILTGTHQGTAYYIGPAYAYFLAAIYKLFGPHLYAALLIQLLMGAVTAALVYCLAKHLFGALAAAVAGVVWAVYLPAVFFETQILPPALTLLGVTAGLYGFARAADQGRKFAVWAFAGGLAFGVAVLARPNILLFLPALALWPVLGRRRLWRPIGLFAAGVLLLVGVVTVRNKIVSGEWVVISSQGGVNFYIGNNPRATGSFAAPPGILGRPEDLNDAGSRAVAAAALGRPVAAAEASRWWFRRGLNFLATEPAKAARLYGTKGALLANNYEVTLNADYNFRRNFSVIHKIPIPFFGIIFALGTVGLTLGWRGGPAGRTALVIYVLAVAASVITFFVVDWYRLPLAPALAVGTGFAVDRLIAAFRDRRFVSVTLLAAAAGLLLTFAVIPAPGCDRDAIWTQSYQNYGSYYLLQQDYERATEHFRKALRYKKDNATALTYLGLTYERMGRDDLAREHYAAALAINPYDPETNYYLAAQLAKAGDYARAAALLETATADADATGEAWKLLGECYLKLANYAAAERALARATQARPADAEAHVHYAIALMTTGKYPDGLSAARRALELNPHVAGAHALVGKYLFFMGDEEAAAREFRAELSVSPGAADPHAFLAEYYDRRGDVARSQAEYAAYRRAGGPPIPKFAARGWERATRN